MKKWLVAAVLAAVLFYGGVKPFERFDTAKLVVVETLLVEQGDEGVTLFGEKLQGSGDTISEAISRMEEQAPGQLFLRQVKRLVFCHGAEKQLDFSEMPEEISYGTVVYRTEKHLEELTKGLADLEKVLDAGEQRQQQLPTLSKLLDEKWKDGNMKPENLGGGEDT